MPTPKPLAPGVVVLDTNVVLDLLLFADGSVAELRRALTAGALWWASTAAMRDEFVRVLSYPQVASHITARAGSAAALEKEFDQRTRLVPVAPVAVVRCSDRDDQMFVDLAVAHGASLWSRDRQVLRLRRRLACLGVVVVVPVRPSAA